MASFGDIAGGAAGGAALGSTFGPLGTAGGAVLGGIASLFGGKKKGKKKVSRFDDQQQQLYDQRMQALRGQGPFADIYSFDPDKANTNFDKNIARPAYRSYEENIVPKITGNFRGRNLQNSSYLGEALAKSGRDVQEGLDAKRYDYIYSGEENAKATKRDTIDKITNMNTFDYDNSKGGGSVIDQIIEAGGQEAGQWFANYLRKRKSGSLS